MFNQRLIRSLEEQIIWQRKQIELLEEKLFQSAKLTARETAETPKPMKWSEQKNAFVPKTEEEIYREQMALQDLLSANEHPTVENKP